MNRLFVVLVTVVSLTACGSGGGDDGGGAGAPAMSQASVDSFFSSILELVGVIDDTGDGAPFESYTVTTPEDTEPTPVI